MKSKNTRGFRPGVGIVELTFAVLAGIFIIAAVAIAVTRASSAVAAQAKYHAQTGAYDTAVLRWRKEAQTAMAVFVPGIEDPSNATDVLGRANTDGHAFDYYFKDASGNGRFVEYLYDGQNIGRYEYSSWAGRVGGARLTGEKVPVDSFKASYLHAYALGNGTANPNGAAFITASGHPAPTEKLVNLGFPGVEAGNRLVKINLSTKVLGQARPEEVHLLAVGGLLNGGQPSAIHNGQWRPPSQAMTISPTGNLPFVKQWDVAQQFTVGEPWYRGGFTLVADSCTAGGVATVTKTGTGGSASAAGTNATWTVAPNPAVTGDSSCSLTIQDDVGQQTAETVSVHYRGPVVVTPTTLHFNQMTAQTFAASEVGCDASNPCPSAFSMAPQSGACAQFNFGGSTPTWSVSPKAFDGSACVVAVYDERGPANGAATVSIDVTTFALSVNPTSVAGQDGSVVSWTATSTGADGTHGNVQITNGRAGAGGGSCAGWTPAGMNASPTTFSVTIVSGQCLVDVVDDRGSPLVTVTITGIPAAPTTPVPTPTPSVPCPNNAPNLASDGSCAGILWQGWVMLNLQFNYMGIAFGQVGNTADPDNTFTAQWQQNVPGTTDINTCPSGGSCAWDIQNRHMYLTDMPGGVPNLQMFSVTTPVFQQNAYIGYSFDTLSMIQQPGQDICDYQGSNMTVSTWSVGNDAYGNPISGQQYNGDMDYTATSTYGAYGQWYAYPDGATKQAEYTTLPAPSNALATEIYVGDMKWDGTTMTQGDTGPGTLPHTWHSFTYAPDPNFPNTLYVAATSTGGYVTNTIPAGNRVTMIPTANIARFENTQPPPYDCAGRNPTGVLYVPFTVYATTRLPVYPVAPTPPDPCAVDPSKPGCTGNPPPPKGGGPKGLGVRRKQASLALPSVARRLAYDDKAAQIWRLPLRE